MRCAPLSVAAAIAAAAGCAGSPSPPDAALDLSVPRDLAGADLAGADLAGADLASGGVHLFEGPCPPDLNNGRCYWDGPPDSFY